MRHVYHVYCFYFGGELLLPPSVRLASLFVIAVPGRPLPIVFGIKLAGLFEYPAASVSVSSWFVGGAMNLAGLLPLEHCIGFPLKRKG